MSLDARMKAVFADAFETEPEAIDDTLSVETNAAWDSMRSIVLAHGLEDEFGIEFSDQELVTLDSYGKIREMLQSKGL